MKKSLYYFFLIAGIFLMPAVGQACDSTEVQAYWEKFREQPLIGVDSLNEAAWIYHDLQDYECGFKFARLSLRKAYEHNSLRGKGDAHNRLGILYKSIGQYDSALYHQQQSLAFRKEMGEPQPIFNALISVGINAAYNGTPFFALSYTQQAQKLVQTEIEKDNFSLFMQIVRYTEGEIYSLAGQPDSAVSRFLAGLEKGPAESIYALNCQLGLAIAYIENNEISKGLIILNELQSLVEDPSFQIKVREAKAACYQQQENYKDAIYEHQQCLELSRQIGDYPGMAQSLNNLGLVFKEQGKLEVARDSLEKAVSIWHTLQVPAKEAQVRYNLALIAREQNNWQRARQELLAASPLAKKHDSQEDVALISQTLAETYHHLGISDSAYLLANGYAEGLVASQKRKNQSLRILDDYAHQLAIEKQAEANRLAKQQTLIYVLIGGLVLLIIISLLALRSLLQTRELSRTQGKIASLENEQNTQYYRLSKEILFKERTRLGKDLHDGLGGDLSNIKIKLDSLEQKVDGIRSEVRKELQVASNLIGKACMDLRYISHDLMEKKLKEFGLQNLLKIMLKQKENIHGLDCQLNVFGMDQPIRLSTESAIYYLISEMVQNIVKHSGASEVIVQLHRDEEGLDLMVEDNGKGFDLTAIKTRNSKGFGLHSISERVHNFGGTTDWDSTPGKGTTISIHLPPESLIQS